MRHGVAPPIPQQGFLTKAYEQTYRPVQLVLRPLSLSIYGDKEQTALRHNISISDISAVARRRKTKRPRIGLFTVFTPARNFHFDAISEAEADAWVFHLRTSSRMDEWESALGSSEEEGEELSEEPQAIVVGHGAAKRIGVGRSASTSQPTAYAYGASVGSFSSISSLGAANFPGSSVSLAMPTTAPEKVSKPAAAAPVRSASMAGIDQERILRNGQLFLLKNKGGVKKWKPVWAVLRVKGLAIYPNREVRCCCWIVCGLDDG
jgi:hypothetical protein